MTEANRSIKDKYLKLFKILKNKFYDRYKAFDKLLEFLAGDSCPLIIKEFEDPKMEWLFNDKSLCEELMANYDVDLFKKSEVYDYLGEIYSNEVDIKGSVFNFIPTPHHIASFFYDLSIEKREKEIILDPCVGSGRFLLMSYKKNPNSVLLGIDIDLKMIRISLTNAIIYNISSILLLNADFLLHEIDSSTEEGRYNWGFANKWNSSIEKLKKKKKKRKIKEESSNYVPTQKQLALF